MTRIALPGMRARIGWLAPAIVALASVVTTFVGLRILTYATLGRDQGIFQYVAWALKNGERAYRDFREINGPLPHAWHMLLQSLGGTDEHVFRTLDTVFLTSIYAACGAFLPRWVGLSEKKLAWGAAAFGLFGAQYLRLDWWHTSQRESFYSVLLFASLTCQVLAHEKKNRRLFLAAGFLTALTWFGKPPCVIFALLQGLVLLFDRDVPARRAVLDTLAGALAAAAAMLVFVLVFEDIRGLVAMMSVVTRLHHTIWNESLVECYRKYGNGPRIDWLAVSTIAFLVSYRLFRLPRRSLLALVLPIGGFVVFAGQGKAFPYHLHIAMLGASVLQLLVLAAAVKRAKEKDVFVLFAIGLALFLGWKAYGDATLSSYYKERWPELGATREDRTSRAYFDAFPWGDFHAGDLRDAARFLRDTTKPDERVQVYGLDPYLLFLAERKSATPILYVFELNVDPALKGGSGAKPNEQEKAWLVNYRDDAERFLLDRMKAAPPAAFVFVDDAPFAHAPDGEKDFAEHCPTAYAWLDERFSPTKRIGKVRVRLRKDVAARASSEPSSPR